MLKIAAQSRIPLIHVSSDDPMHDMWVLETLFGEPIPSYTSNKKKAKLFYIHGAALTDKKIVDMYSDADENEYSVIIINGDCTPQMMGCGELVPNRRAIRELVEDHILKKHVRETVDLLSGLATKDIKRVVSLTSQIKGNLKPASLRAVRDSLFLQVTGVVPVPVETDFFFPLAPEIMTWSKENRDYMFADVDKRLAPKGVLLHGEPGTGKTEFSRFVARAWGIPLFLLDVNAMLTKWQGEAERYLSTALHKLDQEAPCVVLFDEVEKLFNDHSENDTSQRLLSKILWWLQYKESKVLVVMTCNDMGALPPELYRTGRTDSTFEMKGVPRAELRKFTALLLESFGVGATSPSDRQVGKLLKASINTKREFYPQAEVTQWVIDFLKQAGFGI